MIRIDLRYVIPVVMFYVPGLLLLIGGFVLGFGIYEMRIAVAVFGGVIGSLSAIISLLDVMDNPPIWLVLGRGE